MPDDEPHEESSYPLKTRFSRTAKLLFAFQTFNAINFTIALGAPMVLTARYIGASETVIGILNALTPLLVVLQFFAINRLNRVGCRRTMIMGWSARSFMLLLIVPLPFLHGKIASAWLVLGMFIPLLLFNTIRGFTSGAWFPWLTQVIPEEQRGRYLGTEAIFINLGAFLALRACGIFLGDDPEPWRFATLFVVSWAAGFSSAIFLRMIQETHQANPAIPERRLREIFGAAKHVWSHARFRRTSRYCALFTFALAAHPLMIVLFLREGANLSEGTILKYQSASMLGVCLTAALWGKLSDLYGSKPMLRLSNWVLLITSFFWFIWPTGLIHPNGWVVQFILLLGGSAGAAHAVAQMRLVLAAVPKHEVFVGLTLFQVLIAAMGGSAPILFGFMLEQMRYHGFGMRAFVLVLGIIFLLALTTQFLLGKIHEPRAKGAGEIVVQLMFDWPMKVISSWRIPR